MRRLILLLAAAAVLAVIAWSSRRCARPAATPEAFAPAPAAPTVPTTGTATTAPAPPDAAAPPAPEFRMQVFDLSVDAQGVHLATATPAAGRVKAPPVSVAPWRIAFTAYDRQGAVVYAGSLDHPLHRRFEYEDPAQPGALRSTLVETTEGPLQLRLPAELAVARIAFAELRPGADTPATARPLGELTFP